MKRKINLVGENFIIRSAVEYDLEILRNAKNNNKEFFFLKTEITEEEQKNWFSAFQNKEDDFMLMCENLDSRKVFGCMGFRIFDGVIDGYNIIRIERVPETSMKNAFLKLIEYTQILYPGLTFQVRVLKENPALSWYMKIGFEKFSEETNYITFYYRK